MEALKATLARKTIKFYACSNCWGELELKPAPQLDMYFAVCKNCGDETKGYVTQYFVNRRKAERRLKWIANVNHVE